MEKNTLYWCYFKPTSIATYVEVGCQGTWFEVMSTVHWLVNEQQRLGDPVSLSAAQSMWENSIAIKYFSYLYSKISNFDSSFICDMNAADGVRIIRLMILTEKRNTLMILTETGTALIILFHFLKTKGLVSLITYRYIVFIYIILVYIFL